MSSSDTTSTVTTGAAADTIEAPDSVTRLLGEDRPRGEGGRLSVLRGTEGPPAI